MSYRRMASCARLRRARALQGQGAKGTATLLRKDCVEALRRWLSERRCADGEPLFISNREGLRYADFSRPRPKPADPH